MNTQNKTPPPAELSQYVSELLIAGGHPNPEAWKAILHEHAFGTEFPLQRFHVNRAWRHHLGVLKLNDTTVKTMDAAWCLLDEGTFDDWSKCFKEGVLPCILKYQLPLA
jgi:hypothetical protein